MADVMPGGCQCSRVRYEVEIASDAADWCHCRMCQKATGGIAAAFVEVGGAVAWLSPPDWYDSSPVAHRPFCSACGTPLGFSWKDGAEGSDLTVGSFDDPSRFRPVAHSGAENLHEAWLDTRALPRHLSATALPRHLSATTDSVAKRWQAAGLDVTE